MTDQPTYIERVADLIGRRVSPECPRDLLLFYAVLALTTGVATTRENVHDAWAAWRVQTRPDHHALVPYDELPLFVQMLDESYAEAIRQVAGDREEVTRPGDLRPCPWTNPDAALGTGGCQLLVGPDGRHSGKHIAADGTTWTTTREETAHASD